MYSLATIADQLAARGGPEKLAQLAMLLMSTANAELEVLNTRSYDGALSRCRVVLAALFGEPDGRSFDVKFWDGSIDRGNNGIWKPCWPMCPSNEGALGKPGTKGI